MKNYLLILCLLFACETTDELTPENKFKVVVVGESIDCHLPIIQFLEKDSVRINELVSSNSLTFSAYKLDSVYAKVGQNLQVFVEPTELKKQYACITLGLSYPWLTIIEADVAD
ncbi:hypothetical protein [Chondrinema litorale]|uniref:hypothetical protein n=1 Tax=Chondrinema litorale TaxID=2994555 RepID=UPI0025428D3C|nr:hypothetical protein [Chondrinema litorale]UZR96445.1 hypothetical protein OQ292_22570 [Chondrinema litorale]